MKTFALSTHCLYVLCDEDVDLAKDDKEKGASSCKITLVCYCNHNHRTSHENPIFVAIICQFFLLSTFLNFV
jgi:hypothetical protein